MKTGEGSTAYTGFQSFLLEGTDVNFTHISLQIKSHRLPCFSRKYSPAVNPEWENLKHLVNSMNDYLRPHREEVVLALQEFTETNHHGLSADGNYM